MVANPVGEFGLAAVGLNVSVPRPRLFLWTKFIVENDCAIPTLLPFSSVGRKTPSSWIEIPSSNAGVSATHLIPISSLLNQ